VSQTLFKRSQIIQSLVNDRMIDPVTKITCCLVPPDCNIIIRTCRSRRDMNKLWYSLGDMGRTPSSCQDSRTSGAIDSPKSSTRSFNRPNFKYSAGRWSPLGFLSVLHNTHCHQQLPRCAGEPRGWSVWWSPSHDFEHNRLMLRVVSERDTSAR